MDVNLLGAVFDECSRQSAWCLFLLAHVFGYTIFAYLLGSIPFGFILTKLSGKGDIRQSGSGNIGTTNVLRVGGKYLALATLCLDAIKPVVAILAFYITIGDFTDTSFALFIGLAAILGHCFPVWLKFKGGKGVATAFGVLFAAVPWAGVIAAVTWGIVAGFTRYSSLSALTTMAIAPIVTLIYYGIAPALITVLIAALVFWRHKANIQRLLKGEEPKIGQKK